VRRFKYTGTIQKDKFVPFQSGKVIPVSRKQFLFDAIQSSKPVI
jgi:hypothetical protein